MVLLCQEVSSIEIPFLSSSLSKLVYKEPYRRLFSDESSILYESEYICTDKRQKYLYYIPNETTIIFRKNDKKNIGLNIFLNNQKNTVLKGHINTYEQMGITFAGKSGYLLLDNNESFCFHISHCSILNEFAILNRPFANFNRTKPFESIIYKQMALPYMKGVLTVLAEAQKKVNCEEYVIPNNHSDLLIMKIDLNPNEIRDFRINRQIESDTILVIKTPYCMNIELMGLIKRFDNDPKHPSFFFKFDSTSICALEMNRHRYLLHRFLLKSNEKQKTTITIAVINTKYSDSHNNYFQIEELFSKKGIVSNKTSQEMLNEFNSLVTEGLIMNAFSKEKYSINSKESSKPTFPRTSKANKQNKVTSQEQKFVSNSFTTISPSYNKNKNMIKEYSLELTRKNIEPTENKHLNLFSPTFDINEETALQTLQLLTSYHEEFKGIIKNAHKNDRLIIIPLDYIIWLLLFFGGAVLSFLCYYILCCNRKKNYLEIVDYEDFEECNDSI